MSHGGSIPIFTLQTTWQGELPTDFAGSKHRQLPCLLHSEIQFVCPRAQQSNCVSHVHKTVPPKFDELNYVTQHYLQPTNEPNYN